LSHNRYRFGIAGCCGGQHFWSGKDLKYIKGKSLLAKSVEQVRVVLVKAESYKLKYSSTIDINPLHS